MQLPMAVLRHSSDNPTLKQLTSTSDWLAAEVRARCTPHRRWWASLAAVALTYAVLTFGRQHVSAATHPAHMQASNDGIKRAQPLLSEPDSAVSHSRAGSRLSLFGSTVPEVLDRWSDYDRDAPDEPAGHAARHVPSRHMHKQTVWYRSVVDNTTRLNPADTRALKVISCATATLSSHEQGHHADLPR